EQVATYFRTLKARGSRHLTALNNWASAEFDATKQLLVLTFSEPTFSSLLHELSLADAALVYPGEGGDTWQVTSGPYRVKSYAVKEEVLSLAKNKDCLLSNETAPQTVKPFWPAPPAKL